MAQIRSPESAHRSVDQLGTRHTIEIYVVCTGEVVVLYHGMPELVGTCLDLGDS